MNHQNPKPKTTAHHAETVAFRGYNEFVPLKRTIRRTHHWTQPGATYFVTFRLGDSVPAALRRQWREEREIWLRFHPLPWNALDECEYDDRFTQRMEQWTDQGHGECYLRRPDVRDLVARHLLRFNGERYLIDAMVLMPNHVHALLQPGENFELFKLLKGIKGTSAYYCNKLLQRTGTFWMDDSYNRIVRDAEELYARRHYIEWNPRTAGLANHEYTLQLNNSLSVPWPGY